MNRPILPAAYCGEPPTVETLSGRWVSDPAVMLVLAGIAALYVSAAWRNPTSRQAQAAFLAGWGVTTLALLSPLCALSVSLFSARVGQHLLLALAAAPLLAAGLNGVAGCGIHRAGKAPLLAALVFAAVIWFWHAPRVYAATFESAALYWTMHATIVASAVWLWLGLLRRDGAAVRMLMAGLLSTVQMSLLGALITFAPRALYAPHFETAEDWGLTPLADQQLGGALMWGPGCAAFLLAGAAALAALLRDERAGTPAAAS